MGRIRRKKRTTKKYKMMLAAGLTLPDLPLFEVKYSHEQFKSNQSSISVASL